MLYLKNLKTIGELCNSKDGGRSMHFRVKVQKLLAVSFKSGLNNDFIEAFFFFKKIQVTLKLKLIYIILQENCSNKSPEGFR